MKKFLFLGFLFAGNALAATYTFNKNNNKVDWQAVGNPGFLRINAEGGSAEGVIYADGGKVSGALTVDLRDYRTGIELRDEHMKNKYLMVDKYPKAKLVLKNQSYLEGKEITAKGLLTLKDETKPVDVIFTVTGKLLDAKFKIKLSDFPSVGIPSHLGVTVANELTVNVKANL
jgi:polyisoprenoid-binding protein YceI